MTITVTYTSIDNSHKRRTFRTLVGAQKFAQKWLGPHPDCGRDYAVSDDGVGRITVRGATLAELFPAELTPTEPTSTVLNEGHWRLLNTCGAIELMAARADGRLPDCPEVNARIAQRCFWNNSTLWQFGPWLIAEWVARGAYRSGTVAVRRVSRPDESIMWIVAAPNGRWHDSLTTEQAKTSLRCKRVGGKAVLADQQQAERDYGWSISR